MNTLNKLQPRTKVILGFALAITSVILFYISDTYDTGSVADFFTGFTAAFSLWLLVTYNQNN
jgi:zinc transporter ZupT